MDPYLIDNIRNINKKVSEAAATAGRNPDEIKLVAVSKTVSAEVVREAVRAGLRTFGENRVQEARGKIEQLGDMREPVTWHMIGHLQKNKARQAVALFDLIHSVDSPKLLRVIDKEARRAAKTQRVLIEVKLSEEETKHGIDKSGLSELLKEAAGMQNVRVEGLMTMPPYFEDQELSRPYYAELRRLRDALRSEISGGLMELSMGMTNDFEVAVQEGSTMVRVGTAIFGARHTA